MKAHALPVKAHALPAALLIAVVCAFPHAVIAQAVGAKVNPQALLQQDFKDRINKYLDLRKQAARDTPPLKQTTDPAQIQAAQAALAARIRAVRVDAKQGDIFAPAIREEFWRLLYPELAGEDGQDVKKILKDDAPASVPLKVNEKYPDGAPLPTVPAKLLLNLPTLPKELEYRIVGKHLMLRDTEADIIVDYMPNVIR